MADETVGGIYGDPDEGSLSPQESQPWIDLITHWRKGGFDQWGDHADHVDKLYANFEKLASDTRDRQFQIFWANIQVLAPSIYARPPVPVVVPRFRDRRPIYRMSSELLERSVTVNFELSDIDAMMIQIRDDLAIVGRGVPWLRFSTEGGKKKVIYEHLDRDDFAHDPARKWAEVDWVARRGWMTKKEMLKRFPGKKAKINELSFTRGERSRGAESNDKDKSSSRSVVGVWELWNKSENCVVWFSEDCDEIFEKAAPHLTLDGFFPCPRPAYGTVQRRSLIPVPDCDQYKDQLEEINQFTSRIGRLADSLKLKGFYPAGSGELSDAIEAAVKNSNDNTILVPVANWAMFGNGTASSMIVWLPIDQVAAMIASLVELRKQVIDDVYQITGLADIMRGSSEASETLGAQELKAQFGSVRVRDRQQELIRVARDLVRMTAEIMAEEFDKKTLLEMSQLELPTNAEIAKQRKELEQERAKIGEQFEQVKANPEMMKQAQENPEEAKKMLEQAQRRILAIGEEIEKLDEEATIERVMDLLQDQKVRPYVLDVETDSTIAPDENATKQRATEFITSVGSFIGQAMPLVQQVPESAPMAAEMLKYVASQFRAGRQLEGLIEEFADKMKEVAGGPKPPPPEQIKAQAEAEAMKAEGQMKMQDMQAEQQAKQAEEQRKQAEEQRKAQLHELETDIKVKLADHQGNLMNREAEAKAAAMVEKRTEDAALHAQKMDEAAARRRLIEAQIAATAAKAVSSMETAERSEMEPT